MGLYGSLAEASNRSRLNNPFLSDPLMDDVLAPVVGMRWHFDLGITAAKVDEVAAELGQVQQQHALAEQGIPFQVRQAYLELAQHQANITATRKAFRSGRQWLVAAVANFDLGVGEGKDVAEAAVAYAQLHAAISRPFTTTTSASPGSITGPAATSPRCASTCRRCRRYGRLVSPSPLVGKEPAPT